MDNGLSPFNLLSLISSGFNVSGENEKQHHSGTTTARVTLKTMRGIYTVGVSCSCALSFTIITFQG